MKATVNAVMDLVVVTTLFMMTGCRNQRTDEWNNEIACSYSRIQGSYGNIYLFEEESSQISGSHDITVMSLPYLFQNYRVDGDTITHCYFLTNGTSAFDALLDTFNSKDHSVFDVLPPQSKLLTSDETIPSPLSNSSRVTIVAMKRGLWSPEELSEAEGMVGWNYWLVRNWIGFSDKALPEIDRIRQTVTQTLVSPEYRRHYPSYLRAIPLFTEKEVEAEKDTPTIDFRTARYHTQLAVGLPYTLIPVTEKGSPFPIIRKYSPGDKIKVLVEGSLSFSGKPCYYLIETFKGAGK